MWMDLDLMCTVLPWEGTGAVFAANDRVTASETISVFVLATAGLIAK